METPASRLASLNGGEDGAFIEKFKREGPEAIWKIRANRFAGARKACTDFYKRSGYSNVI